MKIKGRINKVNPNKPHGWISWKGLVQLDGQSVNLRSRKDIFVHADNCSAPLRAGMEVVFDCEPDPTRADAFRAVAVEMFVPEPLHVELHIDDTEVSHPTVPMRMCFSPQTHARMVEGLKQGYGYALLLVARREDDIFGKSETRQILTPLQPFSYVTFTRPGNWDVSLILFERRLVQPGNNTRNRLIRLLSHRFLSNSWGEGYDYRLPDCALDGLRAEDVLHMIYSQFDADEFQPIGAHQITVEIPNEVFAQVSPATRSFANRFFKSKLDDECRLRRRLAFMWTLGLLPYLLVEGWNRGRQFIGGLVQLLLMLRGSAKTVARAFKPEVRFQTNFAVAVSGMRKWEDTDLFYPPFHTKYSWFLSPGFWIVYALLALAVYYVGPVVFQVAGLLGELLFDSIVTLLIGLAVLVGAFFGLRAFIRYRDRPLSAEERQQQLKDEEEREERQKKLLLEQSLAAGRAEAAVAEKQAGALVCGDAVHEISLKAIPAELRTFRLRFIAVKRAVCRPFV